MKLHKTVLCNLLIHMQVGYNHAESGSFIPSLASTDMPTYRCRYSRERSEPLLYRPLCKVRNAEHRTVASTMQASTESHDEDAI